MIRRNIEPLIKEALSDAPVILINGARQTGKTTLVRALVSGIREATYVTCRLRIAQANRMGRPKPALMHYRRAAGQEVDYVLEERAGRVAGIEVKSSHAVATHNFAGLRCPAEDAKANFADGVVR
jgi:predicted AAA+ superfamily ATPase